MAEELKGGRAYRRAQVVGLFLGPLLFALLLLTPVPPGLTAAGWTTAALAVWMATWWATEALPLAATALLPLVLLPLFGVASVGDAAAPFANPLIFLFLGGFLIALTVQRWNLHRRIALHVVARIGARPLNLVAGAMLATAGLSMWISNTATTMMMLPIATSLIAVARQGQEETGRGQENFAAAMMLGIAYAASIGGFATLVGSPPNALVASYMMQTFAVEVTFLAWMLLALPVTAIMLPSAWLVLTRVAFPFANHNRPGQRQAVAAMLAEMGPITRPQKLVAVVFAAVAFGWIVHPLVGPRLGLEGLTDTGLAIAGAVVLFALPADWRSRTFLLDWATARRAPWEILLLFGGGLSLAQAIDRSGLAQWLGGGLEALAGAPPVVLITAVALVVILLTELTSNTATTAAFLPVVAALAIGAEMDPLLLAAPVALAASSAYMLPVATPPNAIVFASGHVSLPQMMRAGILLNLIGVIVISAGVTVLAPYVF